MIVVYLSLFVLFIYYVLTWNNNHWENRNVLSEKPFFIFGNFHDVVRGKQHFSEKIREIYNKCSTSPFIGIHFFTQPVLMVRSPEMLKKILIKDFDKFTNRHVASDASDPIAFHVLFRAKDVIWKTNRAKMSPAFTPVKMKSVLPLIKECADNLVTHLKQHGGSEVQIQTVFKKYSVDVMSSFAFGIDASCLNDPNSEIFKMANQLFDMTSVVRSFSIFSLLFIHSLAKIFRFTLTDRAATKYFIKVCVRTMEERRKLGTSRNDLIQILKPGETDDVKMAIQSVGLFSAGNETTSSTLTFAAYELALNQDVQCRLRKELREICDFSYETIQSLKYLDMVVKETLRKYPVTTFLNREVSADYTFEETGLTVRKKDQILVPLTGLHYDPEYFPEPEKFDPERFSKSTVPYTYMPFGTGQRTCIGERFGILATKVALSLVVREFRIELTESTPVPLQLYARSLFMQPRTNFYLKLVEIKP